MLVTDEYWDISNDIDETKRQTQEKKCVNLDIISLTKR